MECRDLVIDGLSRVEEGLRAAVEGLSADQLAFRAGPEANSIAWMAWHLTRVQDDHIAELAGQPQAWMAERWYERFGRPADAHDTGYGHRPEQVAGIRPERPEVLVEYHRAVHARSVAYLQTLGCQDMDHVIDRRWDPPVTVGVRLVSVVDDCAQHVGQMAYVRGLL